METATRSDMPANHARYCSQAIAKALDEVSAPAPISHEAIHNARKGLKKARAALRLLQDGMNKTTYQLENSQLRDAGRFLSPFRDAKSLVDAFESLHDRYKDKLQDFDPAPLVKILHANLIKARRHFLHTWRNIGIVCGCSRIVTL